jgi:hypothetical protein
MVSSSAFAHGFGNPGLMLTKQRGAGTYQIDRLTLARNWRRGAAPATLNSQQVWSLPSEIGELQQCAFDQRVLFALSVLDSLNDELRDDFAGGFLIDWIGNRSAAGFERCPNRVERSDKNANILRAEDPFLPKGGKLAQHCCETPSIIAQFVIMTDTIHYSQTAEGPRPPFRFAGHGEDAGDLLGLPRAAAQLEL